MRGSTGTISWRCIRPLPRAGGGGGFGVLDCGGVARGGRGGVAGGGGHGLLRGPGLPHARDDRLHLLRFDRARPRCGISLRDTAAGGQVRHAGAGLGADVRPARALAGMPGKAARAAGPIAFVSATLLALQSSYSGFFAGYLNGGIAAVIGLVATAIIVRIVRSVSAEWTAARLLRRNRADIARAALKWDQASRVAFASLMVDRLSLVVPRMAASAAVRTSRRRRWRICGWGWLWLRCRRRPPARRGRRRRSGRRRRWARCSPRSRRISAGLASALLSCALHSTSLC